MTTLEIKRIDSVKTRTTSASTGLNNTTSSPSNNYHDQNGSARYSLQQHRSPQSPLSNKSFNNNRSNVSSSDSHQHLPDVVPITIIKSPSYNNQLTSLAQVELIFSLSLSLTPFLLTSFTNYY